MMKRDQWICHNPVFECEQYNPEMLIYSPWAGHKHFAYDYVCFARPRVIVELGSYYGCSAFAFLQAIKDQALDTAFYAVDTWAGDDFTKNDYTEDIYNAYRQINEQCFSGVRSRMLRMTFDEACGSFEDGSIDLLHIDGSHKYEDVKNDYLRWRSKVAADGVIFFHDVGTDLLFGEPMGSHIFWEELKREHPFTAEFPFSNGLGILFSSEEKYRQFLAAAPLADYQQRINLQDTVNKDMIRKNAFTIRDLRLYNTDLQEQIRIKDQHLSRYREDSAAAAAYIVTLENRCAALEQAAAEKDGLIRDLQQRCAAQAETAQEQQKQLEQLDAFAAGKDRYARELEEQMAQLRAFASGKEQYAAGLESQLADLCAFADGKEQYAAELESQLAGLRAFADGKEQYAAELESQLSDLRSFASGKEQYAKDLERQLSDLRAFADGKEQYAAELESQLTDLRSFASDKEQYAKDLECQLSELRAFASGKEQYAQDLENQLTELRVFASGKERYAADLEGQLTQLRVFAADKERYTEELLAQITELNRYADGKSADAARLEADLENLGRFVQQKEMYIAELEKQVSDLNTYADGKCMYIAQLEQAQAADRQENADLTARLQLLTERYNSRKEQLDALCEKVRKLPFGKRLVEETVASTEEG